VMWMVVVRDGWCVVSLLIVEAKWKRRRRRRREPGRGRFDCKWGEEVIGALASLGDGDALAATKTPPHHGQFPAQFPCHVLGLCTTRKCYLCGFVHEIWPVFNDDGFVPSWPARVRFDDAPARSCTLRRGYLFIRYHDLPGVAIPILA
jgi:hypothetical protein